MSNATKLATMIPRPALRRSYHVEWYDFKATDIQRIVRGILARRRMALFKTPRIQRSTNEHELFVLPVLKTPVRPMPSPLDPPPVYRLTREDERRQVTPEEIEEAARNLVEVFEANYP
jgi:hypothetical protein